MGFSRTSVRLGQSGTAHPAWKGDKVLKDSARSRARVLYPKVQPCAIPNCRRKAERHHVDGNTRNNSKENIEWLCKPHHLQRHDTAARLLRANIGKPKSLACRGKISAALTGRTPSPEHRAALSAALKGRPRPPRTAAHCQAIRAAHARRRQQKMEQSL